MSAFKPMLAATAKTIEEVPRPCLVSPKLDGIRVIITEAGPVTRKLKAVPNTKAFAYLNRPELLGLDGEIVWGAPNASDVMSATQTGTMTINGPDPSQGMTFFVFDDVTDPELPFGLRLNAARNRIADLGPEFSRVVFLEHTLVEQVSELIDIEEAYVSCGYEGMMARDPFGRYKYGRSTLNEGILVKVKRFVDAEATIVGFKELMHNENEAQRDNLGRTKRSTHAEGLVAGGVLGSFVCTAEGFEQEFDCGSGLNAAQKAEFWNRRDELNGATITFKYMPYGVKDKPRHPVFKGLRHD